MNRELVMIVRSRPCPYMTIARNVLHDYHVPCREISIDTDPVAHRNLLDWVGFLSVPTLFVAAPGQDIPLEPPAELPAGSSPRSIDRGSMITEPRREDLVTWLRKHGFVEP